MTNLDLTKPQRALLLEICGHPKYEVEYYPPARCLMEKGLAEFCEVHGDKRLYATAAGYKQRDKLVMKALAGQ